MSDEEYIKKMEDLIIDLMDGKNEQDLINEGFSKKDAEKAMQLIIIIMKGVRQAYNIEQTGNLLSRSAMCYNKQQKGKL